MISYKKQSELPQLVKDDDGNCFEQIRKAAEGHRKSDTDGAHRRDRQKADDNRLI